MRTFGIGEVLHLAEKGRDAHVAGRNLMKELTAKHDDREDSDKNSSEFRIHIFLLAGRDLYSALYTARYGASRAVDRIAG